MKNRHYFSLFFGLMLPVGLAAQDWTPPTVTGQELELNDTLYMFNVQANKFLNGNASKQTNVAEEGVALYITQNGDGTYQLGTPTDTTDTGEMRYVYYEDNQRASIGGEPGRTHLNWTIEAQADGTYYFAPDKADVNFGEDYFPGEWAGWKNDGTDIIYPLLDMYAYQEGIVWKFVGKEEYAVYVLDKALSDAMATAKEYGLDYSAALAVYNNEASTSEEKQAALDVLEEAIYQYRIEHATIDNPIEVSSLLRNYDFGEDWEEQKNDIPGWTQEPAGAYTYGDAIGIYPHSIGRWQFDDQTFSDAKIYQIVENAPEGKYQLKVIYTCIDQNPSNPESDGKDPEDYSVTGNTLYVKTALGTEGVNLSSNMRWGEIEATIDFFVTDGKFETGVEMLNSTANWFKIGKFEITYYGKDAAKDQLQVIVDRAKAFNKSVNKSYTDKLQELIATSEGYIANGATVPEFTEMMTALTEAIANAEENAQAYVNFNDMYFKADSIFSSLSENVTDEVLALADYLYGEFEGGYDIDAIRTQYPYDTETLMGIVNQMDFLAQSAEHSLVEEGTDVSGYIVNASFTDKGEGWDITVPEDKIHFEQDLVWLDDSQGGDISQTLLGMPNGVYELSVQAFNRHDWNFEYMDSLWSIGKQDSLRECVRTYVFLNDSQKRVKHAFDDGFNEDFLPENVNTEGWSDWDIRIGQKTDVMMPNTPTGARKYFDKGYYVNTIQAFVIDGTLTFGIHHEGGNWACVDSFSIKYVGKDLDLALELLQERLGSVEKYLDKQMIGTIKTRITESYNRGTALLEQGDAADFDAVIEVVNALATAADGAEESIEAFELLKHANEVAAVDLAYEGVAATESGQDLQAAYDTYSAGYTNESDDLTTEKINEVVAEYKELAMAAKIEKGIKNGDDLTYILSNPSYEDQFGLGEGVNGVYNAPWGWTFCIDSIVCTKAEDMNAAGLNNFTSPDQNVLCTDDGEWGYCLQTGDFPDVYMYQVVKGLPTGTYQVTVDLVVPNNNYDYKLAGQRLYVNNVAQYYGWQSEYDEDLLDQLHPEEVSRTFGGYDEVVVEENGDNGDKGPLNRLTVKVYIEEGEDLTLGVRTDGHWEATWKRASAPEGFNNCGWCKFDNMRLSCLALDEDVTGVEETVANGLQVVGQQFFTVDGIQTDGLKKGVNIVRTQYEDGTTVTKKVIVK